MRKRHEKMKPLAGLLVLLALLFTACGQKGFTLNGELKEAREGWVYLDEVKLESLEPIDSVFMGEDGLFSFSGELDIPKIILLRTGDQSFMNLVIAPGEKVQLTAWYDSLDRPIKLKGSEGTQLLLDYNEKLRENIAKLTELNKIYMDNQESEDLLTIMDDLDRRSEAILADQREYTLQYIDDNPESLASLIALYQQLAPSVYVLDPMKDLEYFARVDSVLYGLYPESAPVQSYHQQFEAIASQVGQMRLQEERMGIGAIPPEIALPNRKGDTVRLSSTRGKVVLLDFWAGWCPPCREENPNLVAAYKKYADKGFEIFQVSLDQKREQWVDAIQEDQLDRWIHVSDLMYWNSIVVPLYSIESIPFSLLLDKDGSILAKNLRGQALLDELEKVFGE